GGVFGAAGGERRGAGEEEEEAAVAVVAGRGAAELGQVEADGAGAEGAGAEEVAARHTATELRPAVAVEVQHERAPCSVRSAFIVSAGAGDATGKRGARGRGLPQRSPVLLRR